MVHGDSFYLDECFAFYFVHSLILFAANYSLLILNCVGGICGATTTTEEEVFTLWN